MQDQEEIRREAEDFYQRLYQEDQAVRPRLDGMEFKRISDIERRMLEKPFSKDEVWKLLSSMKGDKALGPDSFSISFFQKCWHIVKSNLMKVFEKFYFSKEFYDQLNNTFITLIPKKHDAKDLKDDRPISLLSSVYKIISKNLDL